MTSDVSAFLFGVGSRNLDVEGSFVAEIPPGIDNRNVLFKILREKLKLPDYFGDNWDALSECLKDFSWVKDYRILIVHEELPLLGQRDIFNYLDVLLDSVQSWKSSNEHELIVAFPFDARSTIEGILNKGI